MKTIALVVEILTVALLILAAVVIAKYPKDVVRGFFDFFKPRHDKIGTWMFVPIWLIGKLAEGATGFKIYDYNRSQSERRYKAKRSIKFDFGRGAKYLRVNTDRVIADEVIRSFLDFSNTNNTFEDFKIEEESPTLYKCPDNISFYDFNILVQHACGEVKAGGCGVFKSDKLSYYCYQDPLSLHNIIGRTNTGQNFSVYTLDDLGIVQLRINNHIDVKEPEWGSRL